MKNSIKDTLEQIVKILMALVVALIIIGAITVGKRFVNNIQSNVESLPDYEDHVPKYYQ